MTTPSKNEHTNQHPDSPIPHLNPYFILRAQRCAGVWSDAILAELGRARPGARFDELAETFGDMGYSKDGHVTVGADFYKSPAKARSLKLANYALLGGGVSIA